MPEIVIIGAGLTGTSLGYFLKKDFVILEKEKVPGGLCRSVKKDGFTFDYSGHFLHLHQNRTKKLVKGLLKENLREIKRNSSIYEFDRFIPFPFQANLYYLPEKIKRECLKGFINRPKKDNQNFYSWSLSTFGKGITKYFMKPYNEKLWTVSSKILGSDWAAPFVPRLPLNEIINGTIRKQRKSYGYNEYFFYPLKGGIQSLVNAFYDKIDNVKLGTTCSRIDIRQSTIEASDGEKYNYQSLVSTQPLLKLLESLTNLPSEIKSAAEKLRWNSVVCFNVGVKEDKNSKLAGGKHWIYFPEKKYPFYRVGFYKNIMPFSCPENASSMYIEVSHSPDKKINKKETIKSCFESLKSIGIISEKNSIEIVNILEIPFAYVIYDKNRQNALKTIDKFLKKNNIHSIGRYGSWEYSFMEKSIIDAESLAKKLNCNIK